MKKKTALILMGVGILTTFAIIAIATRHRPGVAILVTFTGEKKPWIAKYQGVHQIEVLVDGKLVFTTTPRPSAKALEDSAKARWAAEDSAANLGNRPPVANLREQDLATNKQDRLDGGMTLEERLRRENFPPPAKR